MSFLAQLDWRFATKKFDSTKKVSDADLETLLTAVQKAPTSFGIQPYHVYVVTDPEIRQKMLGVSWNQPQVTDASHILVFCSRTDVSNRIDEYVDVASGGDEAVKTALKSYADMMHGSLDSRTDAEKSNWTGRQTYIALGFALAAAAELGIDSCPMEGFDAKAVDEILGIPPHMKSLSYLAIGYRAGEPDRAKVRFPKEDLVSRV